MFRSLQICRVAASVFVMFFHLGGAFAAEKYFGATSLGRATWFGRHFVIVFFVLSGFLMTWLHAKDLSNPRRFFPYLRKRVTRIYPAYLLVFAVVYVAARLVPSVAETVPHDALTILKSLFLLPQDPNVVGGTGAPVLIVAWSLQFEMFFYAVIGLFILNRAIGLAVTAAIAAIYLRCKFGTTCAFPLSFVGSDYILPFFFGVSTALLVRSSFRIRKPLWFIAFGMIAVTVLYVNDLTFDVEFQTADGALTYGLIGAILIFGLVKAEQQQKIIVDKRWDYWANASYVLFLIHFPVISLCCKVAVRMGIGGVAAIGCAFGAIAAVCFGAALLFRRFVEAPLIDLLSVKQKRSEGLAAPIAQH